MRLAVVSATDAEHEALRKQLCISTEEVVSGREFLCGTLGGREVICCKSGIGKVNAAATTEALILKYSPDAVINSGVCGGIYPSYKPGDVIIADDCVQHDFDTSPLGDERGEVCDIHIKYFPCDKSIADGLEKAALCVSEFAVHRGRIATGDAFISSTDLSEKIGSEFGAVGIDMETCSIAQVCFLNDVPFCAVRAVSDNGTDSAFKDYYEFLNIVVGNSVKIIEKYIMLNGDT